MNLQKNYFLGENTKLQNEIDKSDNVHVFTVNNENGNITPKSIAAAFQKAGFVITATKDTNASFKEKFQETNFDVYAMMTFYKKDLVLKLLKNYPNVGLFSPMSMSIYTRKGTDSISISIVSTKGMAKIMNISAEDKTLKELSVLLLYALELALDGGSFEKQADESLYKDELTSGLSLPMDNKYWENDLRRFQSNFYQNIISNGFTIVGHTNLAEDFKEAVYDDYDFYEVYSICKIGVLFSIAKNHPEAGALAPCAFFLYKKKGEKHMQVGFPSVFNWFNFFAITDMKDIEVLMDAQKRMNNILNQFVVYR